MSEKMESKRGSTAFKILASLFAEDEDCAVIFNSREELILGSQNKYSHMRKFGLETHIGRGEAASKTEAMFWGIRQAKKYIEVKNTQVSESEINQGLYPICLHQKSEVAKARYRYRNCAYV